MATTRTTEQVRFELTAKDRTAQVMTGFRKNMDAGVKSAAMMSTQLLALAGAGGGLTMLMRSAINAGSAITDMATATRTGIEEIQILTAAARKAGASNDQMANLLIRVQKSASDAARGLSTATDAFAKLGIDAQAFLNLSPEQMLETLSQSMVAAGDDTRAYGAAMDLLGTRNAPKLMEVLQRLGTEGFESLAEEAKAAGQIMSEDIAKDMDDAADRLDQFQTRLTKFAAVVTSKFMAVGDAIGKAIGELAYGTPEEIAIQGFMKQAEEMLKAEGVFAAIDYGNARAAERKAVNQRLIYARALTLMHEEKARFEKAENDIQENGLTDPTTNETPTRFFNTENLFEVLSSQ